MNNLLAEGRYDKVTSELTKELARAVMQGKKRLQTRIVVLKRTFVDISVYFKYQEEWDWQSFPLVYGGTYGNPKEIRKNFKNTRIVLHIEVPKDLDYRKEEMAMLVPEMKNIIRHEIEHVLQQRLTDRQREGFFSKHRRYPQDIEYWEYFVEPYEVEAYVRGLYKKARTLQQPLNVLFDEFWKYHPRYKEVINVPDIHHRPSGTAFTTAWKECSTQMSRVYKNVLDVIELQERLKW